MSQARDRWLLGAFVLSGAAGLGYELLWTRLLGLALGSESLGMLGVLAGFFGGMAIGAAALHGRAVASRDPVGLFVRLELIAAGFAVISPYWLHALAEWIPGLVGPMAGDNSSPTALVIAILIAAVALLPGTFCLGATLPALVEARRRALPDDVDGRGLGRLYAANTFGAVLGVLGTVYLLLPAMGMIGGAIVLAGLGATAAVIAHRWRGRVHVPAVSSVFERPPPGPTVLRKGSAPKVPPPTDATPADPPHVDASGDPDPDVAREPWLLLALMAGTGLAGVGLEVVAVQILSQVLENTIFTFAHVLAVYLLGTALGAAIYARRAKQAVRGRPATVATMLLVAHAAITVWVAWMLGRAPGVLQWWTGEQPAVGTEMLGEALIAALVLGPPTVLMGVLFSHIAGLIAPHGLGRAYALNTLGSALAPLVFGVWAIGSLGYRDALISIAYAYLAIFWGFTWFRRFKASVQIVATLVVVALTTVAPRSLMLVEPDEGWEQIDVRETLLGTVIVSELRAEDASRSGPPPRRLQVGEHFYMGGSAKGAFPERRLGQIPLLLHPHPERALYLGVGTGSTLGAVGTHPSLQHVDAVELVPAVLDQLHYFVAINDEVAKDERVHLHAADARRFVAASPERYDVIVADLFHPGRDGAGSLYTREHFEHVREHLAEGGLFAQWLPLYQLDRTTMEIILRTFADVFGEVHVLVGLYNPRLPPLLLVGRDPDRSEPLTLDVDALDERTAADPMFAQLQLDARDLAAAYLLDGAALRALVGEGPLNTDLMPQVLVRAPRAAYEGPIHGRENLEVLLQARVPPPAGTLVARTPQGRETYEHDAARFARAVDLYLQAEMIREDAPGLVPGLVGALDPLLDAYEQAPEFTAVRQTLIMATGHGSDLAERIFPEMLERTPQSREIWREYLAFVRRTGDVQRFADELERAREVLGLPPNAYP